MVPDTTPPSDDVGDVWAKRDAWFSAIEGVQRKVPVDPREASQIVHEVVRAFKDDRWRIVKLREEGCRHCGESVLGIEEEL